MTRQKKTDPRLSMRGRIGFIAPERRPVTRKMRVAGARSESSILIGVLKAEGHAARRITSNTLSGQLLTTCRLSHLSFGPRKPGCSLQFNCDRNVGRAVSAALNLATHGGRDCYCYRAHVLSAYISRRRHKGEDEPGFRAAPAVAMTRRCATAGTPERGLRA